MPAPRRWWRLTLGTLALALLTRTGLPLVALTLAALLAASGARRRDLLVAAFIGVAGFAPLLRFTADPLDAALAAYIVIVAAAFAAGAVLAPAGTLRQAMRAVLWGVVGTGFLGLALRGLDFWNELHWSAVRQTSSLLRFVVEVQPETYAVFDPLVRFFGNAFPAITGLASLAALALAWQWHVRLSSRPLGPPLGAFRQFRFADQWVWGVVGALLIWVLPKLAAFHAAALNLGLVLGVLYLLRGAAVIATLAAGAGVPAWALVTAAVAASVLVLPLLVVVPGLWTVGVFDTWLAFRQRRLGPPSNSQP
jgi:Predicted membrane protein (DUF2232)